MNGYAPQVTLLDPHGLATASERRSILDMIGAEIRVISANRLDDPAPGARSIEVTLARASGGSVQALTREVANYSSDGAAIVPTGSMLMTLYTDGPGALRMPDVIVHELLTGLGVSAQPDGYAPTLYQTRVSGNALDTAAARAINGGVSLPMLSPADVAYYYEPLGVAVTRTTVPSTLDATTSLVLPLGTLDPVAAAMWQAGDPLAAPLIDPTLIIAERPDVDRAFSGLAPTAKAQAIASWEMTYGWKEGTDPGPRMSIAAYLRANPDVAASGMNPVLHFELYGHAEGRAIVPSSRQ